MVQQCSPHIILIPSRQGCQALFTGCRLLSKLDFPDMKFTLYFLGFHEAGDIPSNRKERVAWMFKQPATLELTHNW